MWVINTGTRTEEVCILDGNPRWVFFKPGIPVQLETMTAINYIQKYRYLKECKNPERYFQDRPLKQMIVRDAGIGDLLLLEPVIRAYKQNGNIEINVLTRYPDVYKNNPNIDNCFEMSSKSSNEGHKVENYDEWVDLRSYSEEAKTRHKKHRTDVYMEKFPNTKVEDKEPRLYFAKDEVQLLNKKTGHKYIGICVDASHRYRGYHRGAELVNELLLKDKKNVVVLFGANQDIVIKHKRVIDLQGKTTIRQAINYIRDLDYMISVDTGLMHIALTLHIPTLCIFTIITPALRLAYYTGNYLEITKGLDCIGCGDWHMSKCEKGIPQCMDIDPKYISDKLDELKTGRKIEYKVEDVKKVNIIPKSTKKLTMPIIVQNEEKNLPRFIDLVMKHPSIGRVIAIDGGSTDNTVKLLEKAGAEVYIHPYIKTYHEQQAMQRNISCSYVANGENILIMDIDECFSDELSEYLPILANNTVVDYGLISRRTFKFYKDTKDPNKQIKDYPDFQPRFYKWDRKYKFVGGAHHITLNCPDPVKIQKDIIHFEEEGKDRKVIEAQWANMMLKVKALA